MLSGEKIPKWIRVHAFARDCHDIDVRSTDGRTVLEHQGYMPHGLGLGGGDSVNLTIDIETGTIIGWDKEAVLNGIKNHLEEYGDGEEDE